MNSLFTPAVKKLFEAFRKLSPPEQETVRQTFYTAAAGCREMPAWHWEVLQEREKLREQGLDRAIPAKQAFKQILKALRNEQAAKKKMRDKLAQR